MKSKRDYLVATPITMSIHRRGEDPRGYGAIQLRIFGCETGAEIEISQVGLENGTVTLTLEELTAVRNAAAVLVAQFNDNGEVRK